MKLAYEHFIDFLAGGPTTREVAEYQFPVSDQRRSEDLIRRRKDGGITPDEEDEVQTFVCLDQVLTIAKARAQRKLAADGTDRPDASRPIAARSGMLATA